ncbi:TolC family protein [Algibacter aquimarinus]|uniref:TolC family protein n=1 Tax=Algibacter aquimarinus TaxID=1136748 RepID=A0ABP9GZN0_9FLAO
MKNTFLIFVTYIAFSLNGNAQKLWTLEECIVYACENNLDQKTKIYNSEIDKESFQQSKRDFLPDFNAVSNLNRRFGRYVDPNNNEVINTATSSNTYGVTSSLNLFNNFKKWHQRSQKKLLYHASLEAVLQAKYNLSFDVMNAFYLVKFREDLLQITKEKLEISNLNYELVTSKIELGLLAKSNLYDIESELGTNKLEIAQAQNALNEATLNLIQIMNFNGTSIKLKPDLVALKSLDSLTLETVFSKAIAFLPSIKQQELQVNASEKNLAIRRSDFYPSLALNAAYRTGYFETSIDENGLITPFLDQLSNNAAKSIGLSLRIPITNKWSKHSNVKIAKINILKEKNILEQKKQELYKEIQKTIQKNTALLAEKEENESNLKSKELAFNFAQKKFNKGLATIYELEVAKNNLAQAKIERTRINLQLQYQKKAIDFYCGIAVFPFK